MIYILPFIVTLGITPIVRRLALRNDLTDKAGSDPLKIHKEPVALFGGVVILIAMLLGIFATSLKLQATSSYTRLLGIVSGGMLVFGVGVWDDLRTVSPNARFIIQLLAGVIILLTGIKVNFIPVFWVTIPLTLFYIVGAINAFNVTDGMDGLCVGVSLVSCIGFFVIGIRSGNVFLAALSVILFMSLLGFLPYNFYPAKIFLGDAGSGLLGFMLGAMAVMATSKPYSIANFIAPILVICVPVLDMAFAILRRLIRRKPLFAGDRDHMYDLLLKRGWSQPKVWVVLCGAQAVACSIAVLLY